MKKNTKDIKKNTNSINWEEMAKIDHLKKEDIKKSLSFMSWEEITDNLIDMELEFNEIKCYLSEYEQKTFNLLILLHEEEKLTRIEKTINSTKFLYDEQFVAYDWTNDMMDE